jgi:hypothetical protein
MAASKMKDKAISFTYPVEVRARQLPVKYLASLRNLDVQKLAGARRAEIELGFVKTSCCQQVVRAIIREGTVTEVCIDPCSSKKSPPLPPDAERILEVTRKKLAAKRQQSGRFPMPVNKFFAEALADTGVTVITCYRICLWGVCIDCCQQPSGDWICGRLTIDATTGPFIP